MSALKRLACRLLGHDNVWTLDPISPGEFIVVCLRCRDRGYSIDAKSERGATSARLTTALALTLVLAPLAPGATHVLGLLLAGLHVAAWSLLVGGGAFGIAWLLVACAHRDADGRRVLWPWQGER